MAIKLMDGKKHIIVKRKGNEEIYQPMKLFGVALWATDGNEALAEDLINSLDIKIYNRMNIEKLYDELIFTAANKISRLFPVWERVAAKLFVLKIYKETYGLKKIGSYPDYSEHIKKALRYGIYDKTKIELFSDEEIQKLGEMIDPNLDLMYTYKGINIFNAKYCLNYSKTKKLELPQHAYLRTAIDAFCYEEDKAERLILIQKEYLNLALFDQTVGSPRIINALTPNAQLASCVLNSAPDDTWGLNKVDSYLAQYSKFGGGLAWDASWIRASGSIVKGNRGRSSGPLNFIKRTEQTVSTFDQGGVRKGSAVITYPFWHLDVMNLLVLKDDGGTEDTRARKLMYAMRIHDILKERVISNGVISLFDPIEVPLLNTLYGDEFTNAYIEYENIGGIRKKTISAREFWFKFMKSRAETGNIYCTFVDNINKQNVTNRYVGASNLCQEITVPSRPPELISTEIIEREDGTQEVVERFKNGEIGLCNLASVNLCNFIPKTFEEKYDQIYTMLRGYDNCITHQFYPIKDAKLSNINNRPIGIGVLNMTTAMADFGIKITDEAALQFTHDVIEELYFIVYSVSNQLAMERGAFKTFKTSNWAKGLLPIDLSILPESSGVKFKLKYDWDGLREKIKKFGVRFSLHGAIAPTATSGKAISASESIEPILDLFYIEEGTSSLPALAPKLKENGKYYVNSFQVPNIQIIKLAAIRQRFLDQSQSVNLYYPKPDSAYEMSVDTFLAMELGLKTLYYLKSLKAAEHEDEEESNDLPKVIVNDGYVCESCT